MKKHCQSFNANKTMQITISSTETVTKGPFSNYVTVLWIGGGLKFCYAELQLNKGELGFIISRSYVAPTFFYTLHFPMVH